MIIKKFQQQVERFFDKPAVKAGEHFFTYGQLNRCANRVVHDLLKGDNTAAEPGKVDPSIAALLFEHGADVIVAIIAVLKTNKTYVPMDANYPQNRLLYMLEHSGAATILTNRKNLVLARNLVRESGREIRIVIVDIDENRETDTFDDNPEPETVGNQPAYILYTSGSSGRPKGVLQTHQNILYFIHHWTQRFSINASDRLTLLSSLSHDGAIPDIYGSLLNGAVLYPYDIKEKPNLRDLSHWLIKEKITVWHSVPTLYRYFTRTLIGEERFPHLRLMVLGGEEVREPDVTLFKNFFPHTDFANIYGQTESTVNSIWLPSQQEMFKRVIIGEAIGDTEIFLVDDNGGIVEEMGVGEIVIASDHVALGYWKDKENSKKVFTTHSELGRLYWTGDLGRLNADGSITTSGRKDSQVKIRGFRVETGEIESLLLKHPAVKEVVVMAREDENNDNYLCAYIVSEGPTAPAQLKKFLYTELPDYMIPAYFVDLEKIPLTGSGKIDRAALPAPGGHTCSAAEHEYVPTTNEIEKKLIIMWQELLGMERIGLNSNFFELGGHSLIIITLISNIHQVFSLELQIKDVFDNPTVRELAQLIASKEKNIWDFIEPAEEKEYYELSSAQQRLYISQQRAPKDTSYNIPGIFIFEGKLVRKEFEKALQGLIDRHEVLRTSFILVNGQLVQKIDNHIDFKLKYGKISSEDNEALRKRIEEFVKPFDLSEAPLLRVELIECDKEKHLVSFELHHIIADGSSLEILINDFARLYGGKDLISLPIQYKDYVVWKNKSLNKEKLKTKEEYWLKKLEGFVFTQLPIDHFDSYKQEEGKRAQQEIGASHYNKIEIFCSKYNVTKFVFMITVFQIVLAREIDQADITIGIPVSIREHSDLRDLIGIFLNVLLIRTLIDNQDTFLNCLEKSKQTVSEALNNQDYPYEILNNKIRENSHLKKSELFSIFFNYFTREKDKKVSVFDENFKIRPLKIQEFSSRYDITLYVDDCDEYMTLYSIYKGNIYDEDSIKSLIDGLVHVIDLVLENENIVISELIPSSEEEDDGLEEEFDKYYDEENDFILK
ncbi:MAG: amino acid adenylation domain-containing protein [Candidatus Aminicenantes bacterium]|nr:MAG: amino acid adenylation domain-containing protein [Candidatus Aminicenantes bacterium]